MIKVKIERSTEGRIRRFTVKDHGSADIVCPAVSLLTLNTANCLEALTDQQFTCEYDPKGGYLQVELEGQPNKEADLILEVMAFGLRSTRDSYPSEIEIKDDYND